MIPNADITVYNKYIDSATRSEKYQRAEVKSVVWQSTKAISQMRTQTAANTALILIPFERDTDYLAPRVWQALPLKVGSWTLQEGDVIVRGIVTDEITGAYTITDLRAEHEDVVAIVSVDAMDQGSANVQHWEVNCK